MSHDLRRQHSAQRSSSSAQHAAPTPGKTTLVIGSQPQTGVTPSATNGLYASPGSMWSAPRTPNQHEHKDKLPPDLKLGIEVPLDGFTADLNRILASIDVDQDSQEHRLKAVRAAARELEDVSSMVNYALSNYDVPKSERAHLQQLAERAALGVNKLVRFVRTRTPHKQVEDELMTGVRAYNELLDHLGCEQIESRDAAVLSERATHTEEVEAAAVKEAAGRAKAKLATVQETQAAGVEAFYGLAQLKDHEPPPFVETLLKALAKAVLVEMSMGFGEALQHMVSKSGASEATKDLGEAVAFMISSGGEAGADVAFEAGEEAPHHETGSESEAHKRYGESKIDPKQRALVFFKTGLELGIHNQFGGYKSKLDTMVNEGRVTVVELRRIEAAFTHRQNDVLETQVTAASKAWASYLAHSRLGTVRGNNRVSNMSDYFGRKHGDAREFGTEKSGKDGVLSVLIVVDRDTKRGAVEDSQTNVVGLNSELKNRILADAQQRFSGVELPKEVHVHVGFARATIAFDEMNRMQDVQNWNEVEKYLGESPRAFWARMGNDLEVK